MRAGTTLQQLETQTGKTITAVRRLESTSSQVASAVTSFTTTVGLADSALRNLYAVFGQWSVAILKTAGDMERLTVQLTNMSQAASDLERSVEGRQLTRYLQDLAQQAPFALRELSQAFVRLRSAGIENTTEAMNALVNAVAASGGSSEQLERASIAIQQMAGKGVLSMEELRQQLGEAVPRAMPLLARAMGMTMGDLVNEISQGRVRAAPALQAMLAEFQRTFGSSAVTMMNTFSGQLNILQTNFQRLQLAAAGSPGSGGFLDRSRVAIERINQLFSSQDAQGFAVRLGQTLGSVVDRLVQMGEWVLRNIDGLTALAQVVGGVLLINLTRWFAIMAISQLAPIIASIVLMTREVQGLAVAMGLLNASSVGAVGASAARWVAMGAAASGLGAVLLRVGATAASVTGGIVSGFATITAALTGNAAAVGRIVAGFSAAGAAMAGPFTRLAGLLSTTGSAAAAFRVTLIALGAGGAVTAGIFGIGAALQWLRGVYRNLTLDAGASYQRLQQGANDTATILKAQQEAEALQLARQTAERNRDRLQRFAANPNAINSYTNEVDGQNVIPSVPQINRVNRGNVEAAIRQQAAIIDQANRAIEERQSQAQGATARRLTAEAEQHAANVIAGIQRDFQSRRSAYDAEQTQTQRELEAIQDRFNSNQINRTERDGQTTEVRQRIVQRAAELEASFIRTLEERLAEARRAILETQGANNEAIVQNNQAIITKLNEQIDQARERAKQAEADIRGASVGLGAGRQSQLDQQALTATTNMIARTQELNAEIANQAGNLARINSLIEQNRFGKLTEEAAAGFRKAAEELDNAEAASRRFRAAQTALQSIDTGLARQMTEAQGLADTLGGSNMSSAFTSFLQFQRQMAAELAKVTAGMDAAGAAAQDAASKTRQAVSTAAGNALETILRDSEDRGLQGQERSEPSGARRLELQRERLNRRYAGLETQIRQLATAEGRSETQLQAALKRLEESKAGELRGLVGTAGRADASAGQSQLNIVQQLQQRLAEVNAEAVGAGSSLARVNMQIQQGRLSGGMADQARDLAAQLDEAEKRAEAARAALSRYNNIVRNSQGSAEKMSEAIAQMMDPSRPDFSRQYETFRRNLAVTEQQLRATNQISTADDLRNRAPTLLAEEAGAIAAQTAARHAAAERDIRADLATTAAERIRLAQESLTIEREASDRMVAQSALGEEEKRRAYEITEQFFSARMQQIQRQNESAVDKMMRDWSDRTTQMGNVAASFMDQFVDRLAEGIVEGKLNFEDLSKSFIKEIIKMELRFAASSIWSAIRGGNSAGGESGIASFIGSIITGAIGGGVSGGVSGGVKSSHTGSIVGSSEMGSRNVAASVFSMAKRFHAGGMPGLRNDEVPTILQKGEGVFTEGQMSAIGRMNHSYSMVESAITAMSKAVSAPSMGSYPSPNTQNIQPSPPKVTINLSNQSGQPVDAMAGGVRFDGDQFVLDVVLRNLQRPGALRDAVNSK